jgi:hypothetical protein
MFQKFMGEFSDRKIKNVSYKQNAHNKEVGKFAFRSVLFPIPKVLLPTLWFPGTFISDGHVHTPHVWLDWIKHTIMKLMMRKSFPRYPSLILRKRIFFYLMVHILPRNLFRTIQEENLRILFPKRITTDKKSFNQR